MNRLKTLCLQVYEPILHFRSWCPARLVSGDLGNDCDHRNGHAVPQRLAEVSV